jgi:hypothetical protein
MSSRLLFASALETGEPDPRQSKFRAAMAAMQAESREPITIIAMEGFRASHVDLGWLSEEILDYVLTMPDCEPEELTELIGEELPQVVQRLKGWSVSTEEWPESISLSFETKDDTGTYRYSLSVHLDS